MTARWQALLVVVGLLLAGCASTPPPPTSSLLPTVTPPASQPPTPISRPRTLPPTATPEAAISPLAEVRVRVRQLADPERPRDDAFQSADHQLARTLRPLPAGEIVWVLDSRVVDGREWLKVADHPFVGCCAPFGWIPAQDRAGEPVLGPPEVFDCPPEEGLTAYELVDPPGWDGPACFGAREITIRGYLACTTHMSVDAAYFLSGLRSWDETGIDCGLDSRFGSQFAVYGDVAIALAGEDDYGEFVDVTGHFFDPQSAGCRWTSGNFMPMPIPGDAPTDTAEFACHMRFVATSVTPLP